VREIFAAMLSRKHILLEGPPGTSKSTIVRSIARSMQVPFHFIEGSIDLTPSKLLGFFNPGKDPGSFQVVLQTKNSTAREAISLSLREMERIEKELVSEKELEGAKKYLTGSFPMRFNTQAKLTQFLSQVEYYGLGLDYPERYPSLINSITREEVLRVAKIYLHPERVILVVVGNLKEAGME
jgi:predicted Zn-dependent peptidase